MGEVSSLREVKYLQLGLLKNTFLINFIICLFENL